VTLDSQFAFDNTFAHELVGLYEPWKADLAPEPHLLILNEPLAIELGIDATELRSESGVAVLAGNRVPDGATPIAQAYAGHQFGGYSPRLGDGRALLLGEVLDTEGRRRDLHLKGSGRTPFARGGDGKAAIGPMVREYIVGEALHGLGIPTTRALAVVATGEVVRREQPLPGAVLTRVAASHLRVGTFQYASATGDRGLLERLVGYAIDRHHPRARGSDTPALELFRSVAERQAALIADWMLVGFVHGVMNTDNMTISGESIDFGPCAFMDAFDPATVFSSIDHQGRYAYGNQPAIGQWNLARLAEAVLPLIDADQERAVQLATEALRGYADDYNTKWHNGMLAKLGVDDPVADSSLVDEYIEVLTELRVDFTSSFRALANSLRGEPGIVQAFGDAAGFEGWSQRWRAQLGASDPRAIADAMDRRNPIYIARNHLVEAALTAATEGDLGPTERLVDVLRDPFTARPGLDEYAHPAPLTFTGSYQTFCGT
jgi:serine/tyrosine/threonine adenylyltransferase